MIVLNSKRLTLLRKGDPGFAKKPVYEEAGTDDMWEYGKVTKSQFYCNNSFYISVFKSKMLEVSIDKSVAYQALT